MGNFRKKYNIKNVKQILLCTKEHLDNYYSAMELTSDINRNRDDNAKTLNSVCPKCSSKKVVEKLIGYKYEGWGGSSTLQKCRHCSECSHDFETYIPKHTYSTDTLTTWYSTLAELIAREATQEEVDRNCPFFSGMHAESFKGVYNSAYGLDVEVPPRISLKKLRKYYPSVFD
jgi:transcription elongation factor Elf1